jgi:hypothetical protein
VKQHRLHNVSVSSIDMRNLNQKVSSKRRISKKMRDNHGSRKHRKPIFLDVNKRKAFRDFHTN